MNKTELIEQIAKDSDTTKALAARMLGSFEATVKRTIRRGGSVTMVGFGTFKLAKRAARAGRNPRTGAAIKIKARKVMVFKTSSTVNKAIS